MQISSVKPLVAFCALSITYTLAAAATRQQPRHDLVRHEWQEPQHLEGWQRRERLAAASTSLLPMRIGFAQPDTVTTKAHSLLMDRANPSSPIYGQPLTAAAVTDLFAPADEAVEAVKRWVVDAGGIAADRLSLSANRQWLQFDARVDETEQLLKAVLYSYEHTATGVRLAACPEYYVPVALQKHIDYITPGTKLASYGFDERVKALDLGRRESDEAKLQRRPRNATSTAPPPPWVSGGCDRFATFDCIREQYGLPPSVSSLLNTSSSNASGRVVPPVPGNELGIFQSLGMHYAPDDLDIYFSYAAPEIPEGTMPELRAIDGATGPATSRKTTGIEANLDLEIAMPLVYPQKTVLWQVDDDWYENTMGQGSTQYPGFFNTFFDAIDGSYCTASAFGQTGNCQDPACRDPVYPNPHNGSTGPSGTPTSYQGPLMCGTFAPTNVIAISYSNVEQALPAAYLRRQCIEVLKLGLQGVTVVVSAGDNGVGGAPGGRGDPYLGCLGARRTVFSPRSLSDCPYVLSVGSTVMKRPSVTSNKSADALIETAPTSFSTGGGFSNIFPTPDWQQPAVDDYLARANLSFAGYSEYDGTGLFNKSGRGYPDVAAVGDNTYIVYQGMAGKIAGTSVAAPIWAAVLTQVNEARLRANKTTVGFVQPVLYQHPEVFTDVIEGSNPGCGSSGFVATAGWDPITGLGTPIFPKLRDLFLSLP